MMSNTIPQTIIEQSHYAIFSPIRRSVRTQRNKNDSHAQPSQQAPVFKQIDDDLVLPPAHQDTIIPRPPIDEVKTFLKSPIPNDIISLNEIARLEYTIAYAHNNSSLHLQALNYLDPIEAPDSATPFEFIQQLSQQQLARLSRVLGERRTELVNTHYPIFKPQDKQLLIEWIQQGTRFSEVERIPPKTFEINCDNNHNWMNDVMMSYVRHII